MLEPKNQKPTASELNAARQEMREATAAALEQLTAAKEAGDLPAGEQALEALQVKAKEFQELRERLTPEELFIAEFQVKLSGRTEVSLTIPEGFSTLDMVHRVQEVTGAVHGLSLIDDRALRQLSREPSIEMPHKDPYNISIDLFVSGSAGKTRIEQQELLKAQGLELPSLADLVAACSARMVASRTLLHLHSDLWVRAEESSVMLGALGLTISALKYCNDAQPSLGVAADLLSRKRDPDRHKTLQPQATKPQEERTPVSLFRRLYTWWTNDKHEAE